nr:MAG TPA: hypothetical protein [Caudoviricetes sp.]
MRVPSREVSNVEVREEATRNPTHLGAGLLAGKPPCDL